MNDVELGSHDGLFLKGGVCVYSPLLKWTLKINRGSVGVRTADVQDMARGLELMTLAVSIHGVGSLLNQYGSVHGPFIKPHSSSSHYLDPKILRESPRNALI